MKLAIKLGNNDFYNTFVPLLNIINDSSQYMKESLSEDKEELCFIINQLCPTVFMLFQHRYERGEMQEIINGAETAENGYWGHIKEYLKITPKRLLLNEEVDEYLSKVPWDNCGTYILDTEVYIEGTKKGYVWTH